MGPSALGPGAFAPGALGRDGRAGAGRAPVAAGRAVVGSGHPSVEAGQRRVGWDGPAPRHLAPSSADGHRTVRALPTRRRGLNWLMLIPVAMLLVVPLYNRDSPRLFGMPFFYWYQLACVLVTVVIVTFVYLMTKGRRPRW